MVGTKSSSFSIKIFKYIALLMAIVNGCSPFYYMYFRKNNWENKKISNI